jgi:hypothetical protein
MSLKKLRDAYNVPAYRGTVVIYTDSQGIERIGRVTNSDGQYVHVKYDDGLQRKHHPTHNLIYVNEELGDDKQKSHTRRCG